MPKIPYQFLPQPITESFRVLEFKGENTGCSWHFHSEYQLSLILKGCGQLVVGDMIHPIKEGELTLLGANLPHVWRYDTNQTDDIHVIVVHFSEDFAGKEFLSKPEMRSIKLLLARANQGLQVGGKTRKAITVELEKLPRIKGFKRVLSLMGILNQLTESQDVSTICGSTLSPLNAQLDIERLRSVCAFIESHIDEPINRDQAAAVAHLSPSAFSRFFKQHTGSTFQTFLNERRIGFACQLLIEGERSVTEVAMQCGFSNTTSFNRTFRKIKDLSPTEYRQRLAQLHTKATA